MTRRLCLAFSSNLFVLDVARCPSSYLRRCHGAALVVIGTFLNDQAAVGDTPLCQRCIECLGNRDPVLAE